MCRPVYGVADAAATTAADIAMAAIARGIATWTRVRISDLMAPTVAPGDTLETA
jgi:hypothetical protein